MAYVDYVYYQTQWGGELDQKDFTILSERASDYIDTITFNRIKENPNLMCDEVKKAVCSVVDEMQQQKTMKTNCLLYTSQRKRPFEPATARKQRVLLDRDC